MLFSQNGNILAFHNSCPHQGRNLNWAPDRFLISPEGLLVCAHHGASFELPSGECLEGPCRGAHLKAVGISVRDGEIWLD
jgi:nitrite reductase/ring-hydroxylating ferredoxin subunit